MKIFIKIKDWLKEKPYWLQGGITGLYVLFLFFLFCLITAPVLIGLNILDFFTENILNPLSRDIIGIDLSTRIGDWFYFNVPNIFGWIYLSFIFFLVGSFIRSFVESFINIIKKKIVPSQIFIVLFGLLFGTYLFSAHFASPPLRCSLLLDGNSIEGNSKDYYKPKSVCLLDYVTFNNNITDSIICDNLNDNIYDYKKSKCFFVIAKRIGDPKYCDHISENTGDLLKEQCYYSLDKNISICKSGSSEIDDKCWNGLAIRQDDYLICDKISSMEEKDSCYISFSLKFQDPNLCEKISDPLRKENCIKFSSKEILQLDDSNKISQDQANYANKRNTKESFNGSIDDENIKLQYDATLFSIIRNNRGFENEIWIGNYEIYPKNNDILPTGFFEAVISIEKKKYIRNLDQLENDQNEIMQSSGSTITKVQRIKLGNYEYIKTISKDKIDYITSMGKTYPAAHLDFRYLPQTDENIKKIENLLASIRYKF